jgi:hypothetical protein
MTIPLWILLPVLTPLSIILTALALQHFERIVLSPSQNVLTDAGQVGEGHAPGGPGDR